MKPIIVVTVQGGLVTEVSAMVPVTVLVEDWDCPLDRPLLMHIASEPLTPEQQPRVNDILAEINDQPDERKRP